MFNDVSKSQFTFVEVVVLKDEKARLLKCIESMKVEQLQSKAVVEELQEKLSKQYGDYRDQVNFVIIICPQNFSKKEM